MKPLSIAPPKHAYKRARTWNMFRTLFAPIVQANGRYLVEPWEVPKDADHTRWWTIVDLDPNGRTFYLRPGFHHANRIGLVHCERAWGGQAEDHTDFIFNESHDQ